MQTTITKRSVSKLKPGQILADDKLTGFVVRCLPNGRLTYGLRYSLDGKRHWIGVGVGISPEAARKAAMAHRGSVALDRNPLAERAARRHKTRGARTLNDILDGYLAQRVKGQRSEGEVKSLLDRLVRPKIGRRPVDALRRLEIVELLDGIAESTGKRTSDKVLSVLRGALSWYALRNDEFKSPIISGMNRQMRRDLNRSRVLDDSEIRSLWAALDGFQPPAYSRLVKALLLSAARRAELGGLQGSEISGDSIVVPAARVKTGIDHTIPITPQLAALIGEGDGTRFAPEGGFMPFSDFTRAKQRLDAVIAHQRARDGQPVMAPWRLHDLRRTARTLMSRANVPSDHAERVLGHTMPTIRGTYDHYDYADQKKAALEKLAALVEAIVAGTPSPTSQAGEANSLGHDTTGAPMT